MAELSLPRCAILTAVQCLTCCFAVPLKRGPNVALSSPQSAVIKFFLARLDRPTNLRPPLGRLGGIPELQKATTPRQTNRDLGSNPCSVACVCSAFPVCRLAVTNITVFPTAPSRFPIYLPRVRTVRWFISRRTEARRQGRPHRLHRRLRRTWHPTPRALLCKGGGGGLHPQGGLDNEALEQNVLWTLTTFPNLRANQLVPHIVCGPG